MKSLSLLAAATLLLAAAQTTPTLAANPESWPSCLGQDCCDLISELPISERSAFRAQHAYCQRGERDERRYEPVLLNLAV